MIWFNIQHFKQNEGMKNKHIHSVLQDYGLKNNNNVFLTWANTNPEKFIDNFQI